MQFYRIKQLAELTGKSERTLQRLLKKIRQERPNYYRVNTQKAPTEPKAIEVNEQLLIDYKLKKPEKQSTEQENNRKQKEDYYLKILHEQLQAKDKQIEAINERLREVQVNLNILMQKIPQLEAPKNNNYNATSDDLSEEVVVGEEQSSPEKKEPTVTDFKQTKKEPKKSRSTTHWKQNKGLKTQATRAKKGQNRKKTIKKPGFWKKVGNWLNS